MNEAIIDVAVYSFNYDIHVRTYARTTRVGELAIFSCQGHLPGFLDRLTALAEISVAQSKYFLLTAGVGQNSFPFFDVLLVEDW